MGRRHVRRKALFVLAFLAVTSATLFGRFLERSDASLEDEVIHREWQQAIPPVGLLRSGDLIFRHSRGTFSNMLVQFSRTDARYSHAGIVSVEGDHTFVYHALGGEASRLPGIRRETLEAFCRPSSVHSFAVYRTDLDTHQLTRELSLAKAAWQQKIPFDTRYDISSDSALYCTEFVYKVLAQASGNENYITLTELPGLTYVACDNLYRNRHTTLIYSRSYSD
jgi:Permuted papain-like amidase enzyme, YaeF/YiiX, C92 family